MSNSFSESLRKQTYRILQSAFYEVYSQERAITVSPNVEWSDATGRYIIHLYTNTGPVLKELIDNRVSLRDVKESKHEMVQSGTFARRIFTTKEFSDSNYNIKLSVKPWGEVQFEIDYLALNPIEAKKLKAVLLPVIAEFKQREEQYNSDAPQQERDAIALTIAAKLKALVNYNDDGVTLNIGLLKTAPETFVTKVMAGIWQNVGEEAKKNLEQQLLGNFKDINLRRIIPRRYEIKLDWPAAIILAMGTTRHRHIETATQPGTQASRG